jgi:hypothetical protein
MSEHWVWAAFAAAGLLVGVCAGGWLYHLFGKYRTEPDPDDLDEETGEQCIYCLRYTYEPGYGCQHCGASLDSDYHDDSDGGDDDLEPFLNHSAPHWPPNWRATMSLELAPETLAAEAERIDLPGPADQDSRESAQDGSARRAGEFHADYDWPTDTRLPAVLNLGQRGDGSDRTFQRWQVDRWQHHQQINALEAEWAAAWGLPERLTTWAA